MNRSSTWERRGSALGEGRALGRRALRAFALCAALLLAGVSVGSCNRGSGEPEADPAGAVDRGVTRLRIEGQLDVGHLGQVKRALDRARADGHDRLIVEIETPGGAIDLMWKLSNALRAGSSDGIVPIAWVNARAISAGVYVALSCERIYMVPGATIGAALPVIAGPTGMLDVPEEGGVRKKVTAEMRAEFRSMAEAHKRSPELAEAMIDPELGVYQVREDGELRIVSGQEWAELRERPKPPELERTIARPGELVSLSAAEAVELGFADGIADSFEALLDKIGKQGATVAQVERARSDDVLTWLEMLAPLLLIAGVILAYTEIKMPGFGLPGILSVACFALLLAGRWLAGLADIPHIVAVALGVALIALEVFVLPGSLWAGISGAVLVIGGLISTSLGPGFGFAHPLGRSLIIDATFNMMFSTAVAIVGALILSRYLPKTPVLRRLVLDPGRVDAFAGAMPETVDAHARAARVGAEGFATSALRPVGKVVLDGAENLEYEARAAGTLIESGQRVRVVETSAGRLVVEPARATPSEEGT